MNLAVIIILFILGIVLIVKGGDFFVDASSWIAEISGIPKLIVGATIVSLATTLPEILVSLMAAAKGSVDMSIGNAVGSVTANVALIMAISLVCIPSVIRRRDYAAKSALMLTAAGVIVVAGFMGEVNMVTAALLLVIFATFLWENVSSARAAMKTQPAESRPPKPDGKTIAVNVTKFVLGAAGIVIGANLLVDNGSELARMVGISERIIGVTLVAVGTSLPELITTLTAIAKKQASLSVGNIIGANIIDLTLILPLCSFLSGKSLPITPAFARFDLPACLLVGAVALVPTLFTKKFARWQGVLLLVIYGVYMFLTCTLPTA